MNRGFVRNIKLYLTLGVKYLPASLVNIMNYTYYRYNVRLRTYDQLKKNGGCSSDFLPTMHMSRFQNFFFNSYRIFKFFGQMDEYDALIDKSIKTGIKIWKNGYVGAMNVYINQLRQFLSYQLTW